MKPIRVLTFVNRPYLDLLVVWCRQSRPHIGRNPTVVCMDEAAYHATRTCAEIDAVPAVKAADLVELDRQSFWVRRLRVIREQIMHGENIVHSDLDALWLASPWATLTTLPDDFVFSLDHGIPKNIREAWGFVLCCGFFMARASPGARALFAVWEDRARVLRDDQIALNTLLQEHGVAWSRERVGSLEIRRARVPLRHGTVSIAVLPPEFATRAPPFLAQGATISHPFFERPFFASFVELYGAVLTDYGRLDALSLDPQACAAAPPAVPPRDVATYHALRQILARRPESGRLLAHLGALQLRLGDPDGALASLHRAKHLGFEDAAWVMSSAETYLRLGQRKQAAGVLRKLIAFADGPLEMSVIRRAAILCAQSYAWMTGIAFLARSAHRFGSGRFLRYVLTNLRRKREGLT